MSVPMPAKRPDASWPLLRDRLVAAGQDLADLMQQKVFVCAVRGLFSKSIGAPGNDINAYDDGGYIVIPVPGQPEAIPTVHSYNFTTDPSRYGWNPHAENFMARLKPGRYKMRRRLHGGRYLAFGQDGSDVTVERIREDGSIRLTVTGDFGIDLHPGGNNSTSSEGCQTLPPDQWKQLEATLLRTAGKGWFPYILMHA